MPGRYRRPGTLPVPHVGRERVRLVETTADGRICAATAEALYLADTQAGTDDGGCHWIRYAWPDVRRFRTDASTGRALLTLWPEDPRDDVQLQLTRRSRLGCFALERADAVTVVRRRLRGRDGQVVEATAIRTRQDGPIRWRLDPALGHGGTASDKQPCAEVNDALRWLRAQFGV